MCWKPFVAALLLAPLAPVVAAANDTVVGGMGSDLVPLTTADVRMLSEDILIEYVPPGPSRYDVNLGDWDVTALYTFENLAERALELQVGFPEYACEGGDPKTNPDVMCDEEPLSFEGMRTTVDGRPVEHRKGTIERGHPWAPRLGQVWLYDVRFEPGRRTEVVHRYRVRAGLNTGGTAYGAYVTRTGASWAGTIGHARFRIRVPKESRSVEVEPGAKDSGLERTLRLVEVDGASVGELLLEAKDWEPAHDLDFSFTPWEGADLAAAYDRGERDCPMIAELWSYASILAEPNDGSQPRRPGPADIERFAGRDLGDPRICKNLVFAMYGRRFSDEALNRYFYGEAGFVAGSWPFAAFEPNPNYDRKMHRPSDWAALQLIDGIVARQKAGQAAPAAEAAPAVPLPVDPATSAPVPDRAQLEPAPAASAGCGACSIGSPRAQRTPYLLVLAVLAFAWRKRARLAP